VHSQVLLACVRLDLFDRLADRPLSVAAIGSDTQVAEARLRHLLRAAAALGLLEFRPHDEVGLGRLGATMVGNESLAALVEHHALVYEVTKDDELLSVILPIQGMGLWSTLYGYIALSGDDTNTVKGITYYEQGEPYDRPTGTVPGTGTPYPPFENSGTEQPKIDARIDWDSSEDTSWSVSSGWAGTDGIIHSGIGPFDIDRGSSLGYAKASWAKRAIPVSMSAGATIIRSASSSTMQTM